MQNKSSLLALPVSSSGGETEGHTANPERMTSFEPGTDLTSKAVPSATEQSHSSAWSSLGPRRLEESTVLNVFHMYAMEINPVHCLSATSSFRVLDLGVLPATLPPPFAVSTELYPQPLCIRNSSEDLLGSGFCNA